MATDELRWRSIDEPRAVHSVSGRCTSRSINLSTMPDLSLPLSSQQSARRFRLLLVSVVLCAITFALSLELLLWYHPLFDSISITQPLLPSSTRAGLQALMNQETTSSFLSRSSPFAALNESSIVLLTFVSACRNGANTLLPILRSIERWAAHTRRTLPDATLVVALPRMGWQAYIDSFSNDTQPACAEPPIVRATRTIPVALSAGVPLHTFSSSPDLCPLGVHLLQFVDDVPRANMSREEQENAELITLAVFALLRIWCPPPQSSTAIAWFALPAAYRAGSSHPDPFFDVWHDRCPPTARYNNASMLLPTSFLREIATLPEECSQWNLLPPVSHTTSRRRLHSPSLNGAAVKRLLSLSPAVDVGAGSAYHHSNASECQSLCHWRWQGTKGADTPDAALPSPADRRRVHFREYVAGMVFREIADVLVDWDFNLHDEHYIDHNAARLAETLQCMAPGAVVYCDAWYLATHCDALMQHITVPFVMVTGRADEAGVRQCPQLLDHPMLLHWFSQNIPSLNYTPPTDAPMDEEHRFSKLSHIPIGLNGIEHLYLHHYVVLRHLKHLQAVRATNGSGSDAPSLLSAEESVEAVGLLKQCYSVSWDPCTTEQSRLRELLRLDEYVYDASIHQLNLDAMRSDQSAERILEVHGAASQIRYSDQDGLAPPLEFHGNHRAPQVNTSAVLQIFNLSSSSSSSLIQSSSVSNNVSPFNSPDVPAFSLYGRWSKLAVVNFDISTNARFRGPLRSVLCQPANEHWLSCVNKSRSNNLNGSNPQLLPLYASLSQFMYWVSPFGNGLDCHRTWEAFYVGSVPVFQRSSLDPLWLDADLPILLVDNLSSISMQFLLDQAPRFAHLERDWPRRKLLRSYWTTYINVKRRHAMMQFEAASLTQLADDRERLARTHIAHLYAQLQPRVQGSNESTRQQLIQATQQQSEQHGEGRDVTDIWDTDREHSRCWGPAVSD